MAKKASSKTRKGAEAKVSRVASRAAAPQKQEFDVQWDAIQKMEEDVDQQQVNDLTDHVFSSVLSKLGWTRNEQGHLEKAGAEEAA